MLDDGQAGEALPSLRRAWSAWHELPAPYEAARVRVLIARCCDALGDHESAELERTAARVAFEELGMSANLGPLTALKVVGVTAPIIPLAAALLTLVAAYTRSAREAQAWLSVTQLVPTLPLVFAGMMNLAPRLELMAVPSLSQHFLITRLLRAEPIAGAELAISAGVSLALGIVLGVVASRLYRREGLLG